MNDDSESELISAYLDGELTAEEQVRAEQILAASAEARQLLEELRALGGTLQSLPQEKLDEDLGPRVLQVAERRMLSPEEPKKNAGANEPSAGRAADALASRADDSSPSEGFPWRELSWRGMLSPRALIWSAVVVAVAIFIHFNAPPQNVAKLDKDKAVGAAGDKLAEKRKKSNVEESWQAPADAPKKPAPVALAEQDSKKDEKSDVRSESVAKSEITPAAEKAAEGIQVHGQLEARKDVSRGIGMKAMPPAPAKEEAVREQVAKDSPHDVSKPGQAESAAPLPAEKPAAEPAVASGEKLPGGNMAAQGGAVESQNRLMQREGGQSKSAGGQKSADGVVAGKDATELGRGEGGGFGGGGRGGRLAVEKKLDQSKAIAPNEQPSPAPAAPGPVAAPAVASAPMATPALIVPPLSGQKAGSPDVVADKLTSDKIVGDKMGREQAVTVINLNCSEAAARNGAFDKLLSENGIATATTLNNYGRRSNPQYQNFRADNDSLSPGGVQMPLGGTASLGSTSRQQQAVQQPSLNYNKAQREVVENSASRGVSQALSGQPAMAAGSRGTATTDSSRNNSLSGSNSYGANSYGPGANGPSANGTVVLNGGTQSAMADNTANGYNTTQQAAGANQNGYYVQGPAKSANVSNINMVLVTAPSTITYEVDANHEQLASLIKQIRQDREDFSLPDVPPALDRALRKAVLPPADGRGSGGFGGYNYQLKDQATGGGGQAQSAPAGSATQHNARGKQGQADGEADSSYKLRDQKLESQVGAAPAQSQPAPATLPQQPAAAVKTHVVFVLNVVNPVASPAAASQPAAAQPAPAAPPAPANQK